MLVGSVNKGTLQGITYARSLAPDRLIAVSVVSDDEEAAQLPSSGPSTTSRSSSTPSTRRTASLTRPVLRFLDELDAEARDDIITVVIPEFVVNRWYPQVLHNQTALALKARLLFRPNTVVTSVPFHIGEPATE